MLSKDQLVLDNWDVIPVKQTVYNIVATANGTWRVEVNLFMEVTGDANTDKVVVVPTELVFAHPEFAFIYIQAMGPLFPNTAIYVLIIDNIKGTLFEWDLTKKVTEQPGFNANAFADEAQRAIMAQPAPSDSSKLLKAPTHTGPITIN